MDKKKITQHGGAHMYAERRDDDWEYAQLATQEDLINSKDIFLIIA